MGGPLRSLGEAGRDPDHPLRDRSLPDRGAETWIPVGVSRAGIGETRTGIWIVHFPARVRPAGAQSVQESVCEVQVGSH